MLADLKRRLREQSEHYLLLDAARRLGKDVPSTVKPYGTKEGRFWRSVFVPIYRRVPWATKRRAMDTLRMTRVGREAAQARARPALAASAMRPPERVAAECKRRGVPGRYVRQ
jgi:hypothetical protein